MNKRDEKYLRIRLAQFIKRLVKVEKEITVHEAAWLVDKTLVLAQLTNKHTLYGLSKKD